MESDFNEKVNLGKAKNLAWLHAMITFIVKFLTLSGVISATSVNKATSEGGTTSEICSIYGRSGAKSTSLNTAVLEKVGYKMNCSRSRSVCFLISLD